MPKGAAAPAPTHMFVEASEAPGLVGRQLRENEDVTFDVAARLSKDDIHTIVTCARGSSDHAARYGKYLFESLLGKPVSTFSHAIASIYGMRVDLKGTMFLAVSQSGKSDDLLRSVDLANAGGAFTVALTNATDSPLSELCDATIPILAGEERSVAATKSFICSMTALAALAFRAGGDGDGLAALERLPGLLEQAWEGEWDIALPTLSHAQNLFVTGRGFGFGVAKEAALKLKETSGLHAEALSAAELRHGPMAVVADGFPILAFVPSDAARQSVTDLVSYCASNGAQCLTVGDAIADALHLECPEADDARLTPLLQIQRFYRFANALSLARGKNPDEPPFLKKVTMTV